MRYREIIYENPIDDWTVDPNFDSNEAKMKSKFRGYDREMPHWPKPDQFAIKSEPHIKRIKNVFDRIPYRFNFYFYQATNPDYDIYLERGQVDLNWIKKYMEDGVADYVLKTQSPETITVIFTNNLTDEQYVSIASPWMVAHRLAHLFINGTKKDESGHRARDAFEDFVYNITRTAYGVKWPKNKDTHYNFMVWEECLIAYIGVLGAALGTTKAAREGKLVTPYEWVYETFAQYLITGDIRLNNLPNQIHEEEPLTTDPVRLKKAQEILRRFPSRIKPMFDAVLKDARGKIWVM